MLTVWILQLALPHKWQSIPFSETHLISHYLCSAWFPFHSLLRCLHFNLESSLWSFSTHLSITTASQISQDLCWRGCFWRINSFNHSTFSKPVILHPNANEHMPHPDWCEVCFHYQVHSCPPVPPTPWLLLSLSIIVMETEQPVSRCLLSPPSGAHILPCHSPHSGSRQKTERTGR